MVRGGGGGGVLGLGQGAAVLERERRERAAHGEEEGGKTSWLYILFVIATVTSSSTYSPSET